MGQEITFYIQKNHTFQKQPVQKCFLGRLSLADVHRRAVYCAIFFFSKWVMSGYYPVTNTHGNIGRSGEISNELL
jgi:hypothetical protein